MRNYVGLGIAMDVQLFSNGTMPSTQPRRWRRIPLTSYLLLPAGAA